MSQQFRLLFASFADFNKSLLRALPNRQNIIAADENTHFADAEIFTAVLDHVQHDKQRLTILLDFRSLMALECVLDRQVVQAEFRLHRLQLGGLGILERYPDEATRPADKQMNLIDGNVSEFLAVLVSGAVNK